MPASFTLRVTSAEENVDVTMMLNDGAVEKLTGVPPTKRTVAWMLAVRSPGHQRPAHARRWASLWARTSSLRVSLTPLAPPIDSRIMQQ